MNSRQVRLSKGQLVVCAILGVSFGLGRNYLATSTRAFNLTVVGCSVVAFLYFSLLFVVFDALGESHRDFRLGPFSAVLSDAASPIRMALRVAGLLLACWLPYLLLMYPGNLSNDTTGQLTMFYTLMGHGERWITAQHPVFDTLVFGAITYPFYAAGHFRLGVFVCIFLQELLTAASFGVAFVWIKRRLNVSSGLVALVLGFMALCPIVPIMVCSLSKDTFFSWVYLVWLVFFSDCVVTGHVDKRHFVVLAVSGALMVLTKKYGFFVAVLSLIVLAITFALKKGRRSAPASLLLVAVVGFAYGVCLPLLSAVTDASPAYRADTLIVPVQQVAMAYSRYPEDFSSEDLETVSQFVGIATIDSGNWYQTNSDTIKIIGDLSIPGGFTDEQVARFLDVWVRMGLKHPGAYVDGWLTLESPLFTFETFLPMFDSEWHTWADPNVIPDVCFDKAEPFAQLSVQINDWYSWLVAVPVLKLFLAPSLYALIIPAYFLAGVLRRKKALLPVLAPVIVTFLGLLISPMVQPNPETMRYLMPFVYATPVLLCMVWSRAEAPRGERCPGLDGADTQVA